MINKLIVVGFCAGCAASVPILYQANPDTFHKLVKSAVEEPAPEQPRTLASAQTARSPAPVSDLSGRKVSLDADARGHFIADFRINGRKVEAMVDTGATLVAINLTTARRIGLPINPEDFKYSVETANGTAPAATATISSLAIGRIHIENVDAVVLQDKALSNTLIGVSFLNRLGKYQVENGTLLLTQ
jgi:aspartyl protease family protein